MLAPARATLVYVFGKRCKLHVRLAWGAGAPVSRNCGPYLLLARVLVSPPGPCGEMRVSGASWIPGDVVGTWPKSGQSEHPVPRLPRGHVTCAGPMRVPVGGGYWKRSWLVGPQSTGGQVGSAAFVQGNSDVKLAETSLVIKRGGENLQLHTSQVLSGNNNWYYNDCILLSIYYVPSSHVSPAVTHTLSHLTTLKSSRIFQLMASYNCFQPSRGHDPVVTALTNTSHFHFLWMPWAIYNENQCLNKTSKNFFNRNSKW